MQRRTTAWALATALLAAPGVAWANEPDEGVVQELLQVLRERGVVDESEYQRLAAKNARYEAQRKSWLPKVEFWGDFRARYEGFSFDEDALGNDPDDRQRGRYRLRLNGKAEVNDLAAVLFQVVSGSADSRSTNQSFGSGVDFDTDDVRLAQAYAQLRAPESWLPLPGGSARLEVGKLPNPFLWKVGKDFMLWDADISFEGGGLRLGAAPTERAALFANAGYFVIDENSGSKDPHLWAAQLGGHVEATPALALGGRLGYFRFGSLDTAFVGRGVAGDDDERVTIGGPLPETSDVFRDGTDGGGNIADGLTGDAAGGSLGVGEIGAYLRWSGMASWPVTVYGNYSRNFDAEESLLFPGVDEEDTAWGFGLEIGDKRKYVMLGAGYWHVEANAFPSQFIDSDLFDGRTNRQGFAFYGSRSLRQNTDLNLTVLLSDEIEDDRPAFDSSLGGAERLRFQADLVLTF